MRRANGTGNIVKMPGARRNPYAVRVAHMDEWGIAHQKYLSYHRTAKEAQEALDEYNTGRAAGTAPPPDKLSVTVADIYHLWSTRKYAKAGKASISSYRASWARMEAISALKIRDVSLDSLQAIIDQDEARGLSKSSINNDKILMKALFRFAMERDIIVKDYSEFVQLPSVEVKYEKGAFNDLQMKQLEDMAASQAPWADTVLMLCYTGFRVTEFLSLTPFSYSRDGDYIRGGMKTEAGKNRVVPVHPKIKPYLLEWLGRNGQTIICRDTGAPIGSSRYRQLFKPVMEALGVPQATPHWCRHTFATRLHAAGVPELEQKRLLGHSDKDITEHYTHTDLETLTAAIRLLA